MAAFAIVLSTCAKPADTDGDLSLASSQDHAKISLDSAAINYGDGHCLPLWPAHLRFSGRVRQEKKFGPPGYGENPSTDEVETILVLVLDRAVDVCADTSSDAPQPLLRHTRELQLTGNVDPHLLAQHLAARLEVFGSLRRQVWGTDYTGAVVRVDSIPQLRRIPRSSS